MRHDLDHIDEQIIKLLHDNARIPLKSGYTAKINPAELGYHIKAFINLEVNPDQKKDFYPYIKSCNNVVECNCVTGDYAMLIEVMFKSTEELDHFIGELQTFGSTKTQIVFSTSVEHRGIPMSDD